MLILTPYDVFVELLAKIFSDIGTAAAALTVTFSLFALIAAVIIALRSNISLAVKVLGSLLVMAICFASNNAFVYAIGIFIVATLVTELEFLEKLAAIVWNRKEYWDYLKQKATPKEVENKIKKEIEAGDTIHVSSSTTDEEIVKDAYEFNRKVLNAFKASSSPLKITNLEENVQLRGEGRRHILDGIAHTDKATYIIEVKSVRLHDLTDAVNQLDRFMKAYTKYAEERGVSKLVRGVLVFPDGSVERHWINDLPILKFHAYTNKFTNVEIVKGHFPDWDWK